MITKIADLYEKVKQFKTKKKLVLAVAHDEHSLEAVHNASEKGLIEPILVGNATEIDRICKKLSINFSNATIINEATPKKAVEKAVRLVHDGEADVLMKGIVGTADLLRGVLNKEWGLRSGNLLSHFSIFEMESYHKLLSITDVAMNILPDIKQKVGIVENAVRTLNTIGISNPKVAMLAAVELVNPDMQATIDAALITKMADRKQIKNCIIDGPLAFDNIVSKESAKHKGLTSEVAGDADLVVVPNIEAGNVLYKSLGMLLKANLAGIIVGAKSPIVLTSRSDSEESKLNSIVLATVASQK